MAIAKRLQRECRFVYLSHVRTERLTVREDGMSRLRIGFALVAALAIFLAPRMAHACTGSQVLLADNFQVMTSNWGAPNSNLYVKKGTMLLSPNQSQVYVAFNMGNLFADMTACIDVAITSGGKQLTHTFGGVAFWGSDVNNFYDFVLGPSGTYSIARYTGGRVITITPFTANPAIKSGLNQVNHIRVVTKGSQATLFANDKQIAVISGQPPQGGGEFAIMALSGPATRDIYAFSNLKITN
jgi:hypothetical protein